MVIEELYLKTVSKIEQVSDDELHFYMEDGKHYRFHHRQECCECVTIEDVIGNFEDLIGTRLTMSEVETKVDEDECNTWTFYKFATVKGYVTVRWYGESNGYYSEKVDFEEVIDGRN